MIIKAANIPIAMLLLLTLEIAVVISCWLNVYPHCGHTVTVLLICFLHSGHVIIGILYLLPLLDYGTGEMLTVHDPIVFAMK